MYNFEEYLHTNYRVKVVAGGKEYQLDRCPACLKSGKDVRIYISTDNYLGFCHHCGNAFNPTTFVMFSENCSYADAKKILYGEDENLIWQREVIKDVEAIKYDFPVDKLVNVYDYKKALDYLYSRNIPDTVIKKFDIKFCPDNIMVGDYTFYTKNRIFWFIKDKNNNIVGWQARDITGKSKMKYIFNKDFKKSDNLFNINNLRDKIDYLFLVEGVFDVFGWMKLGINNIVATFGKYISDRQLELILQKQPEHLILAWDSDAYKEKFRFARQYKHLFKNIYIVDLKGKDADELDNRTLLYYLEQAKRYDWKIVVKSLINKL